MIDRTSTTTWSDDSAANRWNVAGKSFASVRLFPINKTETLAAAAIFAAKKQRNAKPVFQMRNMLTDLLHNPCLFSTSDFLIFTFLPHSGIALPFDLGHLSGHNIDIERSVAADAFLPILFCDGVMTGCD